MGYMVCVGYCCGCNSLMHFNPHYVPSIRVSRKDGKWVPDPEGHREPICEACVAKGNEARAKAGMPPIPVHPEAYSESEEG